MGRFGVASVVVGSLLLSASSALAGEAPEEATASVALSTVAVAEATAEAPVVEPGVGRAIEGQATVDGTTAPMAPTSEGEAIGAATPSAVVTPVLARPELAPIALTAPSSLPVNADAPTVASDPRDRLRVGALVGVGFPRPLAVEGFVKVNRRFAVGAEYSFLPRANLFGADTSFKAAAVDLRLFPFKNGFFVGVRGGRQWLDAKATASLAGESAAEAMSASTWFVNPRLGFLHTFESGITVGLDAGVQIPVGAEYTRTATGRAAGTENDASEALRTAANVLGNKTTPTVDLLRVGFVF